MYIKDAYKLKVDKPCWGYKYLLVRGRAHMRKAYHIRMWERPVLCKCLAMRYGAEDPGFSYSTCSSSLANFLEIVFLFLNKLFQSLSICPLFFVWGHKDLEIPASAL